MPCGSINLNLLLILLGLTLAAVFFFENTIDKLERDKQQETIPELDNDKKQETLPMLANEETITKRENDKKQGTTIQLENDKNQETNPKLENEKKQGTTLQLENDNKRENIPTLENVKKQEKIPKQTDTKEETMFKTLNINMKFYLNTSQHFDETISLGKVNLCKSLLTNNQTANIDTGMLLKLCKDVIHTPVVERCRYSLRIIVLTYNREVSLLRLLTSLNAAHYGGDEVKLEIWIDRSTDGSLHKKTIIQAMRFEFKHGDHEVIIRGKHMGLYGQWLASYKPDLSCKEIAMILEDDIAVSPHFYRYLKLVHSKYGSVKEINGFSLQGRILKFTRPRIYGNVKVPDGNIVYLFPVIGSWGFSPSAENWLNFIKWLQGIDFATFRPYIPNHLAYEWFEIHIKSGRIEHMWTIWHMYYAWTNHEYTLFNYFPNEEGLTTHWNERGLHYSKQDTHPSYPLLMTWNLDYPQLPDKPLHIDISGNVEHK